MVISFPLGVPLAHLNPEESVGSVSLMLRKAHHCVWSVYQEDRIEDPSGASPAVQT